MVKHIDETGKETIYTLDEFFDGGHYSSDTNEDNIEMINDWYDEYHCPHCGDDRGAHDISDRNRLIPCESDGEGKEDEHNWEYSGKDGLWLNNGEPECPMCGRQGYSDACRKCDICEKFNGVGGGDCECICIEEEICPCCGDEWTETTRCDCPNEHVEKKN